MRYEVRLIERALKRSRTLTRSADTKRVAELVLEEIERDYDLAPRRSGGHRTWEMSDG